MKKIIIITALIIITAYSAGWFYVSREIRSQFEEKIQENNINLQYEEFKVSGFPFNFKIVLNRPTYKYKSDVVDVTLKVDGDISFSAGLFATKLKLTSSGTWLTMGHVKGYNFNIKSTAKEDSLYVLKFKSNLLSKDFISNAMALKDNPYAIFKLVDYAEIKGGGLDVHNISTQNKIFSVKDYELKVSLDDLDGKYEIKLLDQLEKAIVGNDAIILWDNIRLAYPKINHTVKTIDPKIRDYFSVLSLPQRGKMNHNIEATYIGNLDGDKSKFKLDIDKLRIHDSLIYLNFDGEVKYGYSPYSVPNLNADLKGEVRFSKKWYKLFQKYVIYRNPELFNFFGNKSTGRSTLLQIVSSVSNFLVFNNSTSADVVPHLDEMGAIKMKADLNLESIGKDYFNIKAKDIDVSTDAYSANLQGDYTEKQGSEEYKFKLGIDKYANLVDDILNYVKRVSRQQNILFIISGGKFEISQEVSTEIKSFIRKISDSPASNSLDIKISANKTFSQKYPSVGKYSSSQFGNEWLFFKTKLVVGEVSRNIKNLIPTDKAQKFQGAIQKGLQQFSGLLSN